MLGPSWMRVVFQGKELVNSRSLQALVAGLKAYSTWENIRCLQDCVSALEAW